MADGIDSDSGLRNVQGSPPGRISGLRFAIQGYAMSYTLEQLGRDIHQTLTADVGAGGKQRVCELVSKALTDSAFVEQHLTADQCNPRKVLYEDPDLGFCICGHVYGEAHEGTPHDHGAAWAIYGPATGETEMTDWEIVEQGSGEEPILVRAVRSYDLKPGDCHYYAPGAVHSPKWSGGGTRLLRIEGKNLDHVQRSNIRTA
jgi:hypothetical protein